MNKQEMLILASRLQNSKSSKIQKNDLDLVVNGREKNYVAIFSGSRNRILNRASCKNDAIISGFDGT